MQGQAIQTIPTQKEIHELMNEQAQSMIIAPDIQAEISLYKKIAKVMSEVHRVPKNGYNSFHKYHYATESDLNEHIRPIMADAGLAFFSTVLEEKRIEFTNNKNERDYLTQVWMLFTLADCDTGARLISRFKGEGQDRGDKGAYKAYTGATKYFLMKTFLIPTGDDPEADTSTDERNAGRGNQGQGNLNFKKYEGPQPENKPQEKPVQPAANTEEKKPTSKQLNAMKLKVKELVRMGGDEDSIYMTLRQHPKVGDFKERAMMTRKQASNALDVLENWIQNKRNQLEQMEQARASGQ
jgi:hypothetical protein